ncbi:MAG TPA: aldolase/citrate lyase family protein [Novosphingobium sp.]|nr:aldolase/citrate lyase family protein [Novosphingobium sp.]
MADHLLSLTWGAEDLPAALGTVASRGADGAFTDPYRAARALALFAAHAARTEAIETVYPAIGDLAGLHAYAEQGQRDGFTGMLALHPAQVPIINAAFTPDSEQVRAARDVVAAFAAAPDAGVLMLGGRMIDAPHLAQARRLLARASATED